MTALFISLLEGQVVFFCLVMIVICLMCKHGVGEEE